MKSWTLFISCERENFVFRFGCQISLEHLYFTRYAIVSAKNKSNKSNDWVWMRRRCNQGECKWECVSINANDLCYAIVCIRYVILEDVGPAIKVLLLEVFLRSTSFYFSSSLNTVLFNWPLHIHKTIITTHWYWADWFALYFFHSAIFGACTKPYDLIKRP